MGTIIAFQSARRPESRPESRSESRSWAAPVEGGATVVILPVIRIERHTDETSDDSGPEQGTATGRRRRRR